MKTFKASVRPNAAEMVAAAVAADPAVPPARISAPGAPTSKTTQVEGLEEETVQINFRVRRRLADELADRAAHERVSQRVLICRALQAIGLFVDPADLSDSRVRRRRGSLSNSSASR